MNKLVACVLITISAATVAPAEVIYNEAVDEFTEEDNSHVAIFPIGGDEFGVGWKCLSDKFSTLLAHKYLAGNTDGKVSVRTKFGDREPRSPSFYKLSDSHQTTLVDASDTPIFTNSAINSDQFMVRVTDPSDGETLTATFDTDGLEDALSKLPCYP